MHFLLYYTEQSVQWWYWCWRASARPKPLPLKVQWWMN